MRPTFFYSTLIAGLCLSSSSFAQSYYWAHGQKVPFTKDSTTYVLETAEPATSVDISYFLASKSQTGRIVASQYPNRFLVRNASKVDRKGNLLSTKNLPIKSLHYGIKPKTGNNITPNGDIIFKPKTNVDYASIVKATKLKFTLIKSEYNTYTIKPANPADLFKIANQLYESGLAEWSSPDFYSNFTTYQTSQSDPLYTSQYYLNNTGQTGGISDIDINAPEAWCYTKGSSSLRVAVLDVGVEAHTDLSTLVPGYDPRYPNATGAPRIAANAHGQACAGIIGATHNSVGIAGVAPNVQIVPVNLSDALDARGNAAFYSDGELANAINWAWDGSKGRCDVLSNSWGAPAPYYSDVIAAAVANAQTQGRAGRGSVVVFAAGNETSAVGFPASLPGVITVGAIDSRGNQSSYSNRGPELDLVAPGGPAFGDIVTLDRMGTNGYNTSPTGDYYTQFNGTSAACPQVAATAALVLSAVPGLTSSQVSNILTQTATDMGPANFDNNFGYGRLNASAAVANALQYNWGIVGPEALCNSSATYTVTNKLPSGTVTWSSSDPNIASINASTGVATAIGSGSVTFTATSATCTSVQYARANVSVNAGPAYPVISVGSANCTNVLQCTIVNFDPSLTYTVNRISSVTPIPANPTTNTFNLKTSGGNTSVTFSVTARNNCGSTTTSPIDAEFGCDGATAKQYAVTAYPNPVSEMLVIPASTERITLLDDKGRAVIQADKTGNLNVRELPEGLYNLQMWHDGKLINQHIQVKH